LQGADRHQDRQVGPPHAPARPFAGPHHHPAARPLDQVDQEHQAHAPGQPHEKEPHPSPPPLSLSRLSFPARSKPSCRSFPEGTGRVPSKEWPYSCALEVALEVARVPLRTFARQELMEGLLPFLLQVYTEAFSQPPYRGVDPAAFADILLRHADGPTFLGLVAEEGGQVVGFASGYTGERGGWWYDRVRAGLPGETAQTWLDRPFELAELAVAPHAQGRGLGAQLHDQLLALASRRHRRAVLSTLEAESRAMHLYRRRGWQVLAPRFRFMPGPTYRILGRRLAPITPAEAARCQIRPATFTDVEAIRAIAWATWTETYRGLMAPK